MRAIALTVSALTVTLCLTTVFTSSFLVDALPNDDNPLDNPLFDNLNATVNASNATAPPGDYIPPSKGHTCPKKTQSENSTHLHTSFIDGRVLYQFGTIEMFLNFPHDLSEEWMLAAAIMVVGVAGPVWLCIFAHGLLFTRDQNGLRKPMITPPLNLANATNSRHATAALLVIVTNSILLPMLSFPEEGFFQSLFIGVVLIPLHTLLQFSYQWPIALLNFFIGLPFLIAHTKALWNPAAWPLFPPEFVCGNQTFVTPTLSYGGHNISIDPAIVATAANMTTIVPDSVASLFGVNGQCRLQGVVDENGLPIDSPTACYVGCTEMYAHEMEFDWDNGYSIILGALAQVPVNIAVFVLVWDQATQFLRAVLPRRGRWAWFREYARYAMIDDVTNVAYKHTRDLLNPKFSRGFLPPREMPESALLAALRVRSGDGGGPRGSFRETFRAFVDGVRASISTMWYNRKLSAISFFRSVRRDRVVFSTRFLCAFSCALSLSVAGAVAFMIWWAGFLATLFHVFDLLEVSFSVLPRNIYESVIRGNNIGKTIDDVLNVVTDTRDPKNRPGGQGYTKIIVQASLGIGGFCVFVALMAVWIAVFKTVKSTRSAIIRLRKGDAPWSGLHRYSLDTAGYYSSTQMIYSLLSVWILATILLGVMWPTTIFFSVVKFVPSINRWFICGIGDFVKNTLIAVAAPMVTRVVVGLGLFFVITDGRHVVRHARWRHVADWFILYTGLIWSLLIFLRSIITINFPLFIIGILRVDLPWLGRDDEHKDSRFSAYISALLDDALHNNPTNHIFTRLLLDDIKPDRFGRFDTRGPAYHLEFIPMGTGARRDIRFRRNDLRKQQALLLEKITSQKASLAQLGSNISHMASKSGRQIVAGIDKSTSSLTRLASRNQSSTASAGGVNGAGGANGADAETPESRNSTSTFPDDNDSRSVTSRGDDNDSRSVTSRGDDDWQHLSNLNAQDRSELEALQEQIDDLAKRARVYNRFHLALMLHRMPWLQSLRGHRIERAKEAAKSLPAVLAMEKDGPVGVANLPIEHPQCLGCGCSCGGVYHVSETREPHWSSLKHIPKKSEDNDTKDKDVRNNLAGASDIEAAAVADGGSDALSTTGGGDDGESTVDDLTSSAAAARSNALSRLTTTIATRKKSVRQRLSSISMSGSRRQSSRHPGDSGDVDDETGIELAVTVTNEGASAGVVVCDNENENRDDSDNEAHVDAASSAEEATAMPDAAPASLDEHGTS